MLLLFLVLPADLLALHKRISREFCPVQILRMHVHACDLVIFVGGVVVDSLVCIATGSINRDLVLFAAYIAATSLLLYGVQDMEELAHARAFRIPR